MKVYYKKLDIMTGVIKNLKETSLSIHKSSFNFFFGLFKRFQGSPNKADRQCVGKCIFLSKSNDLVQQAAIRSIGTWIVSAIVATVVTAIV